MSQKPRLIVQKYGGATLADPQKVKSVAARLSELSKDGVKVVAVVSAMGKTTNQLIDLANQIAHRPNRRELDMLLTTGERVSMALVSMALHELNCPAISFTGSQAGILTDDSHVNAMIEDVKAFRVEQALSEGKVVVLAGFQGVSAKSKEITTLGRGGSDTTAVAMAAYLKAEVCEILKDVPAVFTADPNLIPSARALNELTYEQLLEMTFWGAKVLHYRSVELAKRKSIPLYIGPASQKSQSGTWVRQGENKTMFESAQILSINSHESVLEILSDRLAPAQALSTLRTFLESHEIAFPQILQMNIQLGKVSIFLTGPSEILNAIEKEISQNPDFKLGPQKMASVTATCTGNTTPDVLQKMMITMDRAGIQVLTTLQSAMSTTVVVPHHQRESVIRELHQLI
jgi:aspartate kinase